MLATLKSEICALPARLACIDRAEDNGCFQGEQPAKCLCWAAGVDLQGVLVQDAFTTSVCSDA